MNEDTTLTNCDRAACAGAECGGGARTVRPAYRVERRETGVTLHIALPGVEKGQASVSVEEGVLTVQGTRNDGVPEGWTVRRETFVPSDYLLRLRLREDLDPATTGAELRDGVLSVAIERRSEALPRSIEIN